MTPMILVLVLLAGLLVLFATEWLPVDVTALLLLSALMLGGLLTPEAALASFGDRTVITLAALFVLSRLLVHTGVIAWLGRRLAPARRGGPGNVRRLLAGVAGVSTVTSNTATTAVFLPVLDAVARRAAIPPSRVLMPLAFASILGGTVTLVGTSTNLVVSGALPALGMEPLGFFELGAVGLPLAVLGLLYLFFVAPRLLPERGGALSEALRPYLADLTVRVGSPLVGLSLSGAALERDSGLTVLAVRRAGSLTESPGADFVLQAGDTLALRGSSADLLAAGDALGLVSRSHEKLVPGGADSGMRLLEAVVMPGSDLLGRTLRQARFRERYGLTVLALHRREHTAGRLGGLRLAVGDVLLIQGAPARFAALGDRLAVLGDLSDQRPDTSRAPLAAAIFVGALLLAGLGIVPLVVSLLVAVTLALALRLMTPGDAYRAVEWPVLVLVAAMLAFGDAFAASGAAEWIAGALGGVLGPLGGLGALAGVYLLTLLLTQPMSNQAAALVVLPLAVSLAGALGFDARPFAVTVALAASSSFLTPLEPSCMLVYGPGRYRFFDFVRVGGGLTVIAFALTMLLVPLVWPLR